MASLSWRLVFIVLVASVSGQYGNDFTWSTGPDASSNICNETFADANATGLFTYNPGVPQLNRNFESAKPIQMGVTVAETTANVEWSMWLNTNGANYSDDLGLGYDMCLFEVSVPTTNTYLRGQSDTGNCQATFDSDCNSALESLASGYVLGLVNNATPNPNSNLTAGSLQRVCYEVANSIQNNFPKECSKYMNGSAVVAGNGLTSDGGSFYGGCHVTDSTSNATFDHVITITGTASRFNYLTMNYLVAPFILTWFPVANIDARQSISGANSVMSCLHVDHINPGSQSVPTAPTPTPVGSGGSGLSGGAIAGIVIGVVVGVGLIAGAAFWFWRRSKKSKKTTSGDGEAPPAYAADKKEPPTPLAEAPADQAVTELSPDNELRPELSSDPKPAYEKPANAQPPAELLADIPGQAGSTR